MLHMSTFFHISRKLVIPLTWHCTDRTISIRSHWKQQIQVKFLKYHYSKSVELSRSSFWRSRAKISRTNFWVQERYYRNLTSKSCIRILFLDFANLILILSFAMNYENSVILSESVFPKVCIYSSCLIGRPIHMLLKRPNVAVISSYDSLPMK